MQNIQTQSKESFLDFESTFNLHEFSGCSVQTCAVARGCDDKNTGQASNTGMFVCTNTCRKCDKESELNGSASTSLMKALIGKTLPTSKTR